LPSSRIRDGGSAVERLINWMGGWPRDSLLTGTEWEETLYRAITAAREGRLPPETAADAEETCARLGRRLCERALGAPDGLAVVAITSGADEALLRLLFAFTEPGDTVLTDRLAARPALQLFRRMAVRTVVVPGDESGMDPEALLPALTREKPAFVYASPVCPDPSGRRWDDERRRALAHLCAWAGVPLVRDDRQLALAGPPGSFEAERDAGAEVYSVGQVPPGLYPGLRLGWIASLAPEGTRQSQAAPPFRRPGGGRRGPTLAGGRPRSGAPLARRSPVARPLGSVPQAVPEPAPAVSAVPGDGGPCGLRLDRAGRRHARVDPPAGRAGGGSDAPGRLAKGAVVPAGIGLLRGEARAERHPGDAGAYARGADGGRRAAAAGVGGGTSRSLVRRLRRKRTPDAVNIACHRA